MWNYIDHISRYSQRLSPLKTPNNASRALYKLPRIEPEVPRPEIKNYYGYRLEDRCFQVAIACGLRVLKTHCSAWSEPWAEGYDLTIFRIGDHRSCICLSKVCCFRKHFQYVAEALRVQRNCEHQNTFNRWVKTARFSGMVSTKSSSWSCKLCWATWNQRGGMDVMDRMFSILIIVDDCFFLSMPSQGPLDLWYMA